MDVMATSCPLLLAHSGLKAALTQFRYLRGTVLMSARVVEEEEKKKKKKKRTVPKKIDFHQLAEHPDVRRVLKNMVCANPRAL
jgi:hypothetical protein